MVEAKVRIQYLLECEIPDFLESGCKLWPLHWVSTTSSIGIMALGFMQVRFP